MKDLNHEEDSLPLIEDVLGTQDQASSEMPGLEEPDKEAVSGESCEADKKVEESSSDTRPLCTPEERRHVQRERLNQILLNLLEKIPGKNGEIPCHDCPVSFLPCLFSVCREPLDRTHGFVRCCFEWTLLTVSFLCSNICFCRSKSKRNVLRPTPCLVSRS